MSLRCTCASLKLSDAHVLHCSPVVKDGDRPCDSGSGIPSTPSLTFPEVGTPVVPVHLRCPLGCPQRRNINQGRGPEGLYWIPAALDAFRYSDEVICR